VRVFARCLFRFGIRDIKHVVLVDEDSARPSELFPRGHKFTVLVEDHDAAVAPIRDKKPALTIKSEHVGSLQFAVARTQMTEGFDQLPHFIKFVNSRITEGRRMAFRDEDVAVWRKGNSRGAVEDIHTLTALAGLT